MASKVVKKIRFKTNQENLEIHRTRIPRQKT